MAGIVAAGGPGWLDDRWRRSSECVQRHPAGVAVRVLGFLRLLGAVLVLGAAVRSVGLFGAVRPVGHTAAGDRPGFLARCGGEPRSGGRARLRVCSVGPVGVLRPLGRQRVPAGQRWGWPGHAVGGARLGLVGVVGLLGGLRPVRALGLHGRFRAVGPFRGFGLLGQLRVLGPFGRVRHPGDRAVVGDGRAR